MKKSMMARGIQGFVLVSLLCIWGCEGCGETPLAVLANHHEEVSRDFAAAPNQWQSADDGERFFVEDGVRTGNGAGAELWLSDGSGIRMEENAVIRFSRTPPNSKHLGLRIESGVILIDASEGELRIDTGFGIAILDKGTQMRMVHQKDGVLLDVTIGRARFLMGEEEKEILPNRPLWVQMGIARYLTRDEMDGPMNRHSVADTDLTEDIAPEVFIDTASDSETDPADSDSDSVSMMISDGGQIVMDGASGGGSVKVVQGLNGVPDMPLAIGESAWIHAVKTPVVVLFGIENTCADGGTVKLSGQREGYAGKGRIAAPFSFGTKKYELFCVDGSGKQNRQSEAHGSVVVVKDQGRVRLAQSAPLSVVVTDGRDYNVNYQSKLPAIRVKWPMAPKGNQYTLHVGGKQAQQISLTTPQHLFDAGALAEGRHTFKFVLEDTGMRSRSTSLRIRFDNASDKVALTKPQDGGFAAGAAVGVQGIIMTGWEVTASGGELTVDEAGRFRGTVGHNRAFGGIWLKIWNPGRGTHYYLRRFGGYR
ncbi:MAG: FecR domain-containing protein [Deltaproteobacteria bacterium]|nr:FecR domain-containing protein [Deltaproteobacteria bacterium]MBN2672306.1 FecR domain-containing protein [Deltaproteobacteria bacterium]